MTTSAAVEFEVRGDLAMVELGGVVARGLAPSTAGVVSLSGHLGAGKTTFVKGLASGLGVAESRDVVSPTFLRVVTFEGPPRLVHIDAYRMRAASDLIELGLAEDLAGGAVVAVEWPENVDGGLPDDRLHIAIAHISEAARRVRLEAGGPDSLAWLKRVSNELSAAGEGRAP